MANYGESIKLARLYEKKSAKGNTYLSGRLGGAKIAILKSREVADDGSAIWDVMLSAAPASQERPGRVNVVYGDVSTETSNGGAGASTWPDDSDLNRRMIDVPEDIIPF